MCALIFTAHSVLKKNINPCNSCCISIFFLVRSGRVFINGLMGSLVTCICTEVKFSTHNSGNRWLFHFKDHHFVIALILVYMYYIIMYENVDTVYTAMLRKILIAK